VRERRSAWQEWSRSGSGAITDPGQYHSLLDGTVVDGLADKHGRL